MNLLTTEQSGTSADIELELEYEIEEDIEAELENFVRLNHTGQFEDAHELFNECLSSHDDWYPIAAEYADCLLRQGKFKQLADFSRKLSMTFQDPAEKRLLRLMRVIGNLDSSYVMRQQLQALWPIDGLKPPYTSLRDTDIHILELVLLALVLTQSEPKDLEASLTSDGTSAGPWSVFKDWFYHLLDNRLFWEAQRILQSLFHIFSLPESQKMMHNFIKKAVSTNISEESVQIAVSSLVQRFIYVTKSRLSSPLAVVPWNDAITWALFGVTLAKKDEDSTSLFNCILLRRSLEKELSPECGITLPLVGVPGNDEISDSLHEAVSNDTSDEMNSVALLKAEQGSSSKDVFEFLNSDTVYARDGYQRTALHWAAIKGDPETIDTLLIEGADPGSLDWFGCTPLHYAVKDSKDYEAAHSLIEFDATTVNTKDLSGLKPLHMAILDETVNIAILLFGRGAIMETSDIGALPPFDIGNVDWNFEYSRYGITGNRSDVRASSKSGLISPKIPLASFQPSDLTLTGAKHGALSKRPRSSISDRADFTRPPYREKPSSRSLFRQKSSSDQYGPRTSRSHFWAGLRTAPNLTKPSANARLLGQHTGQVYPPINTPDQNPPCNTLHVGNLPVDTSEDELEDLFSKQKGYKRLCFGTKQNGPMCFVEFEDVSFATKALQELYGHSLHNSTEGGIRLSFSKNPLGVREVRFEDVDPSETSTRPFDRANDPPPSISQYSRSSPRDDPWNPLAQLRAVKLPLKTPLTASEMHQSSPSGPTERSPLASRELFRP